MNKKNKVFTLIVLLAVIVILAVLVLVATLAVTSIMQKSAKNDFKSEVLQFTKDVDRAFTEKSGKKIKAKTDTTAVTDTSVYNVTVDGAKYKYLCMTLAQLVSEQYTKKTLGSDYYGYIEMWVPDAGGETITFVNVTNTAYYLQGKLSVISDSKFSPSQSPTNASGYTDLTKCPAITIPADSVKNE